MACKAFALFLAVNLVVLGMASAAEVQTLVTTSSATAPFTGRCSLSTLRLGVCAGALGLVKVKVGTPPVQPCCSLVKGLVDVEAAVCLCTAVKAVVGILPVNVPIDFSLVLNNCGKTAPTGFRC